MYTTTCTKNEHLLLSWIDRLSRSIQESENNFRQAVSVIHKELKEVKGGGPVVLPIILKVVEYSILAFGIGWVIYQNVSEGMDARLIVGSAVGTCLWSIGKYNSSRRQIQIDKLEESKYLKPSLAFKKFERLLESIQATSSQNPGYFGVKTGWERVLGDLHDGSLTMEAAVVRCRGGVTSSDCELPSGGDVDDPLPRSTSEEE